MERRFDTIKPDSNRKCELLAQRLNEIRELRKLVRKAEAKRRQEKSKPGPAGHYALRVQEIF
jgi:hypothetical protein